MGFTIIRCLEYVCLFAGVKGVNQNFYHLGCSKTTKEEKIGCQPVKETCPGVGGGDPSVVLLQLSTSSSAEQCYCEDDECNTISTYGFKNAMSYMIVITGILGIIGNGLAFGVMVNLDNSNKDIYIILKGNSNNARRA